MSSSNERLVPSLAVFPSLSQTRLNGGTVGTGGIGNGLNTDSRRSLGSTFTIPEGRVVQSWVKITQG